MKQSEYRNINANTAFKCKSLSAFFFFTYQIDNIQSALKELDITGAEEIIRKINGILTVSKATEKARALSNSLSSKYSLPSGFDYYDSIQTDKYDILDNDGIIGGYISKKAGKIRYGYDASDAIGNIQK